MEQQAQREGWALLLEQVSMIQVKAIQKHLHKASNLACLPFACMTAEDYGCII